MADVLWRDTALTPKIFILDARAVFPLALCHSEGLPWPYHIFQHQYSEHRVLTL